MRTRIKVNKEVLVNKNIFMYHKFSKANIKNFDMGTNITLHCS